MASKNIGRARILQELKNLQKDNVDYLHAEPLESDLYTWHFTFRGPENTDFHEGLYHGQIILPFEYPFKPPDIIFANKNGRFQVNTKICLTITQYHTEEWNSAWTIRTMLQAVVSLFNEKVVGHGYLESSSEARRFFAKASHDYTCEKCGKIIEQVKPREPITLIKSESKKVELPIKELSYRTMSQKKEEQITKLISVNSEKEVYEAQKMTVRKQSKDSTLGQYQKSQQIQLPQNDNKASKQKNNDGEVKSQYSKQSKTISNKNQRKKISGHSYFYNALIAGNEEYLAVIKSKKLLHE